MVARLGLELTMVEPTEEQLIKVADAVMQDLSHRSGAFNMLISEFQDDPEIYREIRLSIGRRAWDVVVAESR